MSDVFTRDKIASLERIALDRQLPPSAARVAIVLSRYMNRVKGYAWPSVATLAEDLGLSDRAVQKALRALQGAGYLVIEDGGGHARANRYRWRNGGDKPRTDVHPSEGETPNTRSQGVNTRSPKPRTHVHPIPLKETTEETIEGYTPYIPLRCGGADRRDEARADDGQQPDRFEEFWSQYPRRVAKGAARRAWAAAIKHAAPAAIIRGAMRYAAERESQDQKFTKHPATWLRAECWSDEPPQPVARSVGGSGGGQGVLTSLDVANALIQRVGNAGQR